MIKESIHIIETWRPHRGENEMLDRLRISIPCWLLAPQRPATSFGASTTTTISSDTKMQTVGLLSDKYARQMLSSINSVLWTFGFGHWEMVSIDTRDTDDGELALAYIAARDNRDEPAMSAIEQEATLRIARDWLERNLPAHFPDDRHEDGRTAVGADDHIPF